MFDQYPAYEPHFAQVQLVCFMLAMGTTLSLSDFALVFRQPKSFVAALLMQLLVIPWVAVLIDVVGGLDEGIAVGLVLVAAMPGGAMSKLFSYLGRGNAALSISLTAFTTLASLVTVPAMLQLLVSRYIQENFEMPVGRIFLDLVLFLLLPLVLGMVAARVWPAWRRVIARWSVRVGLVVVVVMVAGSLGSGRIRPGEYGWGPPIAIILFCLIGQQVGMLPFYIFGLPRSDRMAAGIEVTMRNMNLALLLTSRLFPGTDALGSGVLFVVLFYAATAMVAGVPLVLNHRWLWRRDALYKGGAVAYLGDIPVEEGNETTQRTS
jgi:bile acid:Na+ symporter, BASS family